MKAPIKYKHILSLGIALVHCSCDLGGSKKRSLTGDMVEDTFQNNEWVVVESTAQSVATHAEKILVDAATQTITGMHDPTFQAGSMEIGIQTGEITPPEAPKEVGLRETKLIRAQILPEALISTIKDCRVRQALQDVREGRRDINDPLFERGANYCTHGCRRRQHTSI